MRALDADPGAVLAYGATQAIDEAGRLIPSTGKPMPSMTDADPARRFREAVAGVWSVDQEMFGLFRSDALRQTGLHAPYPASDHNLLREMALLGRFTRVQDIVFFNRSHEDQSARIADDHARRVWQDAQAQKSRCMDTLRYVCDLASMTICHRRFASPAKTLPCVLLKALSPRFLSYFAD